MERQALIMPPIDTASHAKQSAMRLGQCNRWHSVLWRMGGIPWSVALRAHREVNRISAFSMGLQRGLAGPHFCGEAKGTCLQLNLGRLVAYLENAQNGFVTRDESAALIRVLSRRTLTQRWPVNLQKQPSPSSLSFGMLADYSAHPLSLASGDFAKGDVNFVGRAQ